MPGSRSRSLVAGKTIGAIGLSFAEGRTFRPADLEYVESLARQTGLALDRTLLLEDEQRARARAEQLASDLSRLHAFATALGAATSTSEVGTLVCEQVKSILGASACAVYVPFESDQFQLLHGAGSLTPGADPTPDGPTWPDCLDAALNPPSSLWLATADDWNGAEPYGVLRTPDGLAVAVVPLAAGGQPSGSSSRGSRRTSSRRRAGNGSWRRWCGRRRSRSSACDCSRASGRRGSRRRPPRSGRARCTRWRSG